MPLSAVFLDAGHTLFHEEPSRYAIYAEVARAHGADVDAEEMEQHMRRAHRTLPRELDGAFRYSDPWFHAFIARIFGEELGLPPEEVAAVTEELFERFEDPATFVLYPGARELLADLRTAGLTVGVISNWSARLPRLLRALELDEALDLVVCSALEGAEKPEPALFERALERAGVAAGEALHAGDSPHLDVAGARAAGMTAVLVDHHGEHAGEDLRPANGAGPHARVSGLPELARWILEHRA